MNITTNNYRASVQNMLWASSPEAFVKTHNSLIPTAEKNDWALYHKSPVVKNTVDKYFDLLAQYLEKDTNANVVIEPNTKQSKLVTKHKMDKAIKPAKEKVVRLKSTKLAVPKIAKEVFDSKAVEHIDSDVAFIKKYVTMHNKTKTADAILRLIKGLQKAMLERRITKQSPYATEIMAMQNSLNSCYDAMGGTGSITLEIQASSLKKYEAIAHSETKMLSITLLAAYIRLHGAKGMREVAKKLQHRITDAFEKGKILASDKYKTALEKAQQNLTEFLDAKRPTLSLHQAELNGLSGIVGMSAIKKKALENSSSIYFDPMDVLEMRMNKNRNPQSLNGIENSAIDVVKMPSKKIDIPNNKSSKTMTARELMGKRFETIGLKGKYAALIGDPAPGFSAMIYGKPKQGKSTFAILFAKELARYGKVLYCAIEEGFGYTLKEKIQRLKADVPNLIFSEIVLSNLNEYRFVFIDSVSDAGFNEDKMKELRSKYPNTCILGIHHATKSGSFRGGQTYAHDVDVIIEIKEGFAYAQGRFAPAGEMRW